jgi:hypothetical protein
MTKKLIFLHIPKTAGSTFKILIKDTLGDANVIWAAGDADKDALFNGDPASFEHAKVIGGHFMFRQALARFGSSHSYLSVLRDPVARAISAHNYIMRRPEHGLYRMMHNRSMLYAIRTVRIFRDEMTNYQCNYLIEDGARTAENAIASVRKNGMSIFTLTQYAEMLETAKSVLGLTAPLPMLHENAAPPESYSRAEYADPELIREIEMYNDEDIRLYQHFAKSA